MKFKKGNSKATFAEHSVIDDNCECHLKNISCNTRKYYNKNK